MLAGSIRRLSVLRLHPVFLDEIFVHAPLEDAAALWREFLGTKGLNLSRSELGSPLRQGASDPRPSWALFFRGHPKAVRFGLEPAPNSVSQFRILAGPDPRLERLSLLLYALACAALNASFSLLLAHRERFESDGDPGSIGILLPFLILFGGYWAFSVWLSTRLTAGRRFVTEFGAFLTSKVGVVFWTPHFPRADWCTSAMFGMAAAALLGVIGQLTFCHLASLKDSLLLVAVCGALLLLLLVFLLAGSSLVRWLTGQASFIGAVALSLQNIVPLLMIALAFDGLQTAGAVPAQPGPTVIQLASVVACGSLLFAGELILLGYAAHGGFVLARSLDHWHTRTETYGHQSTVGRFLLILGAIPAALVASFFLLLACSESIVFIQDLLLRSHHLWGSALLFEYPIRLLLWLAPSRLGSFTEPAVRTIGELLLVLHCTPVLLWGGTQVYIAFKEIRRHLALWKQRSPIPAQRQGWVEDIAATIAADCGLRAPLLRFESSPFIFARAVISPIPGLPKIVILSTGALESLPQSNLRALLAHELGHIKLGHTRTFSLLRLISRLMLLGPGFFTGLLRTPDRLEAEADRFAILWLEAHAGSAEDLIQTLTLAQQQQFLVLINTASAGGVPFSNPLAEDWLPSRLRQVLNSPGNLSWHQRVLQGWHLLYYLTMHAGMVGYVHLPPPERAASIRRMKRTPGSHE